MTTTKVAVTIDTELLAQLDQLVAQRVFPNRSKAIQAALQDKLSRLRRSRLARESAKLDPRSEQALAEEAFELELAAWPEY
jgi:metal-responsive CopG/Arc/MetJ family transcriptional regulator